MEIVKRQQQQQQSRHGLVRAIIRGCYVCNKTNIRRKKQKENESDKLSTTTQAGIEP